MEQQSHTKQIKCPHCHTIMTIQEPKEAGVLKIQCPNPECKKTFLVKFGSKASLPPEGDNQNHADIGPRPTDLLGNNSAKGKAVLVKVGKGLLGHNETFGLKVGVNVVGRDDNEKPSDIAIKDDKYMSRRSVEIDVIPKESGLLYKLRVKNATNPVLHNGERLYEEESVYLNYGDTIKLGQTLFRFEEKK